MIFNAILGWLVSLVLGWVAGWQIPSPAAVVADFSSSFGLLWDAADKLHYWVAWWAIPPAIMVVFSCWFLGLVVTLLMKFLDLILKAL